MLNRKLPRSRRIVLISFPSKLAKPASTLTLYAKVIKRGLKPGILISIALFILLSTWLLQTAIFVLAPNAAALVGKVIVVDPGHGGIDPGAHDRQGVTEKDIVLDIARHLFTLLGKAKAIPIQTRHGDWALEEIYPQESTRHRRDLAARVHIANRSNADAMVCIHVNKSPSQSARGPSTFHSPSSLEGKRLAWCIQRRLMEAQSSRGQGVQPGDFYILRNSKVPTVIVEVGFLSNPEEKQLLLTSSYREKIAEALFCGLADFFAGQDVAPTIAENKGFSPNAGSSFSTNTGSGVPSQGARFSPGAYEELSKHLPIGSAIYDPDSNTIIRRTQDIGPMPLTRH